SSYAPPLYPAQPTYPHPASGQPPPNSNAFASFNIASAQASYEQNRSVIPGLAFGASTSDVPAAWPQTHQPTHAQPSHEPNLVPASQYYQPRGGRSNGASNKRSEQPGNGLKSQHASDRAEEGELSEGEYDDLYEPTASNQQDQQHQNNSAQPGKQVWPNAAAGPGDAPTTGRDSYSPYLSPHEIQPALKPVMSRAVVRTKEQPSHSTASQVAAAPPAAPSADSLLQAKTKARSAILGLWSLDVRYDDFVSEGIDKDLVRALFNDLGLDPVSDSHPNKDGGLGSQIPGLSSSNQNKGTRPVMPQSKLVAATGKAEERKDRIARLLAAKQALSGTTTAAVSTGTAGAENSNEKQLNLQQKMVALQKSREARAQKAASRKGSEAAQPAPSSTTNDLPSIPPPSLSVTSTPTHPLPAKVDIPVTDSARSVIPGLFMPSTSQHAQSPSNQRKRPVATDFDDYAQANIHTRPLGPSRKSKLVIDVSEGSDDDVEMEIGSGDESNTNVQTSDHPFRRTTSFRDVPTSVRACRPATILRYWPCPRCYAPRSSGTRKKLKSGPDSSDTADALSFLRSRAVHLDPSLSVGSNTNRSSPVAPETGSIKLPRIVDIARSGSDRLQRVRVLSQSLPGMRQDSQATNPKLRTDADKEDTDGGVELPLRCETTIAEKTVEPVAPSASERLASVVRLIGYRCQHTLHLRLPAETSKKSSPDTGVVKWWHRPVPVTGNSHASNVADRFRPSVSSSGLVYGWLTWNRPRQPKYLLAIDGPSPDEGLNNNAREPRPSHQDDRPNLPVCPDQLDGRRCPRDRNASTRSFRVMKLPARRHNIDGPMRVSTINGLRELLQDMRQRNIKDFLASRKGWTAKAC
ncbi:hypothetical protein EV126DRAFT_437091, partial [Verticillium dahliae]